MKPSAVVAVSVLVSDVRSDCDARGVEMSDLAARFRDFYDASSSEEQAILAAAAMALNAIRVGDEPEVVGFEKDLQTTDKLDQFEIQDLIAQVPKAREVFSSPWTLRP